MSKQQSLQDKMIGVAGDEIGLHLDVARGFYKASRKADRESMARVYRDCGRHQKSKARQAFEEAELLISQWGIHPTDAAEMLLSLAKARSQNRRTGSK